MAGAATKRARRTTAASQASLQPTEVDAPTPIIDTSLSADVVATGPGRSPVSVDEIKVLIDSKIASFFAINPPSDPAVQNVTAPTAPATPVPLTPVPGTSIDADEFLRSTVPWVERSTISKIVLGTLDFSHLIKLLPPENLPDGISLASSETLFPSTHILFEALCVYGAIRGLYDTERTGIAAGIQLYQSKLSHWARVGIPWTSIIRYAMAHFRTYQSSKKPSVWTTTDMELYSLHILAPAPVNRPTRSTEHCRKWNSVRGCTYLNCRYLHACSICNDDHPASTCYLGSSGASVNGQLEIGSIDVS
jgi:hypothetical protein